MEASEVFSRISDRQVEGMMLHGQMADYYDFLGLMGFKRLHEYRYLCESASMRGVHRYYINHFNALLPQGHPSAESAIPAAWSNFTRRAVGVDARREATRSGMETWAEWEHGTKRLYEQCYRDLCDMGEVAAACKVRCLVGDADQECKCADRLVVELGAVDYDPRVVVPMQREMHEEYREKTEKIGVSIC